MRCLGCMELIPDGSEICPLCRHAQRAEQMDRDALPAGTLLQENRFLIGKELGRGGFGITYISYDNYLQKRVAIKEFFPKDIVSRNEGEQNVYYTDNEIMRRGIRNVMREAQKMQRLEDIKGVVHVRDIFKQNGTAYIGMDYVNGITLKDYMAAHRFLSTNDCVSLMMPVLDIMISIHETGLIHRDISPDNIMIQPDNTIRILDMGAAKDLQMETGNTFLVARNGFSPPEQYNAVDNIGPWTDVYAICATMYYCMIGAIPPGSAVRDPDNCRLPVSRDHPLPPAMLDILNAGMEMRIERRIPDVEELKRRLSATIPVQKPADGPEPEDPTDTSGIFGKLKKILRGKNSTNAHSRVPIVVSIEAPYGSPFFAEDISGTPFGQESDETVLDSGPVRRSIRATLRQKETGNEIVVCRNCFLVGRTSQKGENAADWQLDDPTRRTSRRHIAIIFDDEYFYVQNITEKNTARLNGQPLYNCPLSADRRMFPKAYRLQDGDVITLAADDRNPAAITLEFHMEVLQ